MGYFKLNESCNKLSIPKTIAEIRLCGSVVFRIDDTMGFIEPTEEQIKNLHDMLCIDVKLFEVDE